MWHMTPDTWHMTPDTWHLTSETRYMTHVGGWRLSQSFSFWINGVLKIWRKRMTLSELMSDKCVCGTAPATPGLWTIKVFYPITRQLCPPYFAHCAVWVRKGGWITENVAMFPLFSPLCFGWGSRQLCLHPSYSLTVSWHKAHHRWSQCVCTLIKQILKTIFIYFFLSENKPAAQAAGADPSRWSSTNGKNPPIQQNRRNFLTIWIWMPFRI